jgi:TolA-binding protein
MTRGVDKDLAVIGRALGPGPDPSRQARQRTALARALANPRPRRLRLALVAAAAGTAVAAAVAVLLVIARPPAEPDHDLACRVRGGGALRSGTAVSSGAADIAVDFAEGSSTRLHPRTHARFLQLERDQVTVELYRGRLDAEVVRVPQRRRVARWTYRAGPYSVQVTGTIFQMAWDPSSGDLGVTVARGRVRVVGPGIGAGGLTVERGEQLDANSRRRDVRLRGSDRLRDAAAGAGTAVRDAAPAPDAPPRLAAVDKRRSTVLDANAMRWKALAAEGRFADAARAAHGVGLQRLFAGLAAKDLYALADALRLAGELGPARSGFEALRARYRGHPLAATATFQLGRLAWEAKSFGEAARRFRAFLRAAPASPLASDARGRLMVALSRSGHADEARQVAADYLRLDPDGSFAAFARKLRQGNRP